MGFGKEFLSSVAGGLGNVVTGASGYLGSSFLDKLTGNDPNKSNQQMMAQQNAFNAAEAQKNRDFQLAMFNRTNKYNSPKEQVARMVEAGLNPDLMYGGNGSSVAAQSPSGSQASSAGMIPKLDMQLRAAEINKTNAEAQLIKSQTNNTDADTDISYKRFDVDKALIDKQIQIGDSVIDLNASTEDLQKVLRNLNQKDLDNFQSKLDNLTANTDYLLESIKNLKKVRAQIGSEIYERKARLFMDSEKFRHEVLRLVSEYKLNFQQARNLAQQWFFADEAHNAGDKILKNNPVWVSNNQGYKIGQYFNLEGNRLAVQYDIDVNGFGSNFTFPLLERSVVTSNGLLQSGRTITDMFIDYLEYRRGRPRPIRGFGR